MVSLIWEDASASQWQTRSAWATAAKPLLWPMEPARSLLTVPPSLSKSATGSASAFEAGPWYVWECEYAQTELLSGLACGCAWPSAFATASE